MKKVKKKTTNNDNKERLSFIFGAILFGISIYLCFAFVSYFSTGAADQTLIEEPRDGEVLNEHHEFENTCGSLGAYAAWFFIKRCFGLPAFLIPLLLFVVAIHLMKAYRVNLLKWTLSVALLMIWASVALATFLQPLFADASFSPGGDHGMFISNFIGNLVGAPGLTAILALIAVAFLTYFSAATVIFIRKMLNPTLYINKVKFTVNRPGEAEPENYEPEEEEEPLVFDDPATQTVEFKDNGEAVVIDEGYQNEDNNVKHGFLSSLRKKKEPEVKPEETEKAADSDIDMAIEVAKGDTETADKKTLVEDIENMEPYDPKRDLENYHYPTLDLLKKYDNDGKPYIDMAEQTANKNRIVDVLRTFGVEISSIKATVGPTITLKTITNEVFMFDLAKAPHLLVAGATGQGKSVGLNAIITSLLYKKHPAELKIVLVDPKKVEFSFYEPIANHFLAKVPDEEADPIITDVTKVVRTLNSLCKEMDTRYDLLKIARAHNIKEYNQKFIARQLNPNNGHRFLPYIVVVIDEFGDLIMTAGKEVELPIARIAQLARAVGIHMIIATQRPTTNIITGTIKANFPSRIAFKVSAGIDSKTILDRTGAQQLIGRGDMLALVGGSEPERVQCAFVDTPEVERINEYISDQQSYGAPFELPEPDMPEADMGDGGDRDVDMAHLDPLFDDAARLIVMNQSGSTSLIQRKFAIGYNRAGRLMDQLEKAGVVGAAMGSKPREVLIQDENSLNNLLSNLR